MLRNFIYKLYYWEYWPAYIFNIPVIFFWLWHSLRARAIFFFAAANPSIETGGLLGESKEEIMQQVPAQYKPKAIFIKAGTDWDSVSRQLLESEIVFPLFAKPNIGERGFMVSKIDSETDLKHYHELNANRDFLIQAYVAYPLELSVLHYRFPGKQKGIISSLCIKEYLSVTGDGQSSLEQLIDRYPRARFQKKNLIETWGNSFDTIPERGKRITLVPIGNHARGAMFLNENEAIDEALHNVFDEISHQLDGILFARYDLKCASLESLKAGKDFAILEINGAGAEPAHIYDPENSLLRAYRDLFKHWNALYRVSKAQHTAGVPYMNWTQAREAWRKHRQSLGS